MQRWRIPTIFEGKNKDGLTSDEVIVNDVEKLLLAYKEGYTYSYMVHLKNGETIWACFNEKGLKELAKKHDIREVVACPGTDNTSFCLECYYKKMDTLVSPDTAKYLKDRIKVEFIDDYHGSNADVTEEAVKNFNMSLNKDKTNHLT